MCRYSPSWLRRRTLKKSRVGEALYNQSMSISPLRNELSGFLVDLAEYFDQNVRTLNFGSAIRPSHASDSYSRLRGSGSILDDCACGQCSTGRAIKCSPVFRESQLTLRRYHL